MCRRRNPSVVVSTDPGICGFSCTVTARQCDKRMVTVAIGGCECKQIQRLAALLTHMSLKALFTPLTRNSAYIAAEKAGCHSSCVVPAAVIKAVEVAFGMALPKAVHMNFKLEDNGKYRIADQTDENHRCRSV